MSKSFAILITIICFKNIAEADKFRKYLDNVCNSFDVRSTNYVQSKFECISSCFGKCAGVSYDDKSKECIVRKCQLKENALLIETEKKCYLKENDFCTNNVGQYSLSLLSSKSTSPLITRDNCLVLSANTKTIFGIDLEAQYLISEVDLNFQNILKANVNYKSTLYYPVDSAINLFNHSANCGDNHIETNGENVIIEAICSPCSVYGRYLLFDFDILQFKSEGDALLCGVNITGCLTQ